MLYVFWWWGCCWCWCCFGRCSRSRCYQCLQNEIDVNQITWCNFFISILNEITQSFTIATEKSEFWGGKWMGEWKWKQKVTLCRSQWVCVLFTCLLEIAIEKHYIRLAMSFAPFMNVGRKMNSIKFHNNIFLFHRRIRSFRLGICSLLFTSLSLLLCASTFFLLSVFHFTHKHTPNTLSDLLTSSSFFFFPSSFSFKYGWIYHSQMVNTNSSIRLWRELLRFFLSQAQTWPTDWPIAFTLLFLAQLVSLDGRQAFIPSAHLNATCVAKQI